MADEPVEETTEQGWGGRLKDSFKSIVVGLVVVAACMGGLFFNEYNLVMERKSLKESESKVIELPSATKLESVNDGRLIHVSGLATTESTIQDEMFGVTLNETLKLHRGVQMYQYIEKTSTKSTKKTGGKVETTTTYNYVGEWESTLIDSTDFKYPNNYQNPTSFPFKEMTKISQGIKLGAFSVPDEIINKIYTSEPLDEDLTINSIPAATLNWLGVDGNSNKTISVYSDGMYTGYYYGMGSPEAPVIGDTKIVYSHIPGQIISIVALQKAGGFVGAYTSSNNRTVLLVMPGNHSIDTMFTAANQDLTQSTWVVRLLCLCFMSMGLSMLAEPLIVFLDVLPLLGNCAEFFNYVFSFIVAFCLWIITVALAWLWFRPIFSLSVFASVGLLILLVQWLRNQKQNNQGGDEQVTLVQDLEAAKPSYTDAVVA